MYLKKGPEGCETQNLHSITGKNNVLIPKWNDLTNGKRWMMLFDSPRDIPGLFSAKDKRFVVYHDGSFYSRLPKENMHLYNGFKVTPTDIANKKVSALECNSYKQTCINSMNRARSGA